MNAEDVDAAADCFVEAEKEKSRKEWQESNEKRKADNKQMKAEFAFKKIEKDGEWTLAVIEIKDKEKASEAGIEWKMAMVEEGGKWKLSDAKSEEYQKKQIADMFKKE
jgi:hypothetical protein